MNTMIRARTALSVAVLAGLSLLAVSLLGAAAAAGATSGGVGTSTPSSDSTQGTSNDRELAKYDRLWERVSQRERGWARRTAACESGGDPDALGAGGRYRGAFQFMRSTWKTAPKSPGGDPIAYSYRTQAVVAIALMRRDGTGHWPNCG